MATYPLEGLGLSELDSIPCSDTISFVMPLGAAWDQTLEADIGDLVPLSLLVRPTYVGACLRIS